jgi:hypothetical protein
MRILGPLSNEDLDRWEGIDLEKALIWTNPGAVSRPEVGRTLALDLGAITGFAWTDGVHPDLEHVGTFDLRHQKRGRALLRQPDAGESLAKLPRKLHQIGPDVVVYEIGRGRRGVSAAQNYGARLGSAIPRRSSFSRPEPGTRRNGR